jgi:peptidoglycan hydrolase-like protein with peptidoglycan-binding domain
MNARHMLLATALMAAMALSCGGADTESAVDLGSISRDLTIGSSGADVRAVHEYLSAYGYFPNDELARTYPAWRPIESEAPAAAEIFDAHTASAIRGLQKTFRLPMTGIVDAATREVLAQVRCGVPDGLEPLDGSDKFAWWLYPGRTWWTRGSTVTYKILLNTFTATSPAFTAAMQANVPSIVAAAFNSWAAETSLSFQPTTGTPNITIQFGTTQRPTAGADTNGSNLVITVNKLQSWSARLSTDPCSGSAVDLLSIVTHEVGHALGLAHSSKINLDNAIPTMWPSIDTGTCNIASLEVDDQVAISSRYDVFQSLPGIVSARDIGVGANGAVWVISGVAHPSGRGYKVGKWTGNSLTLSDSAAVRISVAPDGRPWVVDNQGGVYRLTTTDVNTGVWETLPGVASDIAVGGQVNGGNGTTWCIGGWCGGGDCPIFKWDPSINNWVQDASNGAAVRIAVGPDGIPWVLTASNNFYRYTTSDPMTGNWSPVTGLSTDLAIGPSGYVWSYGTVNSGKLNLAVWDEQAVTGDSNVAVLPLWTGGVQPCNTGPTSALAVGPKDTPYVICNGGTVMSPTR